VKQCGSNSHADSPLDPNTVFTGTILCFLRDSNIDADHFEGLYPGQATRKDGWDEVRSLAQMQADPWDVLTAIAIGLKPNRSASRPVAYPGYLEPDASPATLLVEEREHVTRQAAQEDARKKRLVAERFATQPEQLHPPASMAQTFREASLREDRQANTVRLRAPRAAFILCARARKGREASKRQTHPSYVARLLNW